MLGVSDPTAMPSAILAITRSLARQTAAEMFRASLAADNIQEAFNE